ncbi:MAG: right-handed parallel beta-helix repeat-containing protein [Verrucomicrobiales bacterium]
MDDFRWIPLWAFVAFILACPAPAGELQAPGDFGSVQAAIDAAAPGDSVVVRPGVYRGQIRVRKGVHLRSTGDGASGKGGLLRAEATVLDGGGKCPVVILDQDASIDGLTVTGGGKFDQGEFDAHFAERGENLPDDRGVVGGVGAPMAAISIGAVDAQVLNCIVHDNGYPGIGVSGAGFRTLVAENHVYRNMGGGIAFADGAGGQVRGNRCWENLRAGIGCRNAAPLIVDNRCYGNVRAGIGIREGASPVVRGNRCYENQRAGIGVRMAGSEAILESNHCYENGMAGIGCRAGAAPLILRNECYRNRLAGIGAQGDARPTIVGNKIYANGQAAIGFEACESGEALVRGNVIEGKSHVCLGVQRGWAIRVEENEIRREGGMPPLAMVFDGASADFVGNRFTGSGVAAIRSQGQVFVCENRFECPAPREGGAPQNAVWALEGSMLSMSDDNVIRGWRETDNPAVRVASREELLAALDEASAGTTILISPGEYAGGVSARGLRGEPGKPIVIAAADRRRPPVFEGGNSGFHLTDPRHVELRNLVISGARGNGLNIDDGGSFASPAQHLKLAGLLVRDIDGRGNRDGIKLSGVRDFRIEGCRLERWGDGGSGIDLVGCHDGVITESEFEHGADVVAANGVQAKGGSSRIEIRRCHFVNAGGRSINLGGSTGADYFRPPDATAEASVLLVEDCLFEGSMAPLAFVGVAGATVRRNTILRPGRWVLRILQENTDPRMARCRGGRFEHNLVAFRSDELRTAVNVGANTEAGSFRFSGNEWICIDKPAETHRLIQLPTAESGGVFAAGLFEEDWDEEQLKGVSNPAAGVRWLPSGGLDQE